MVESVSAEQEGRANTQVLLTLYTVTNNYILQYRNFAFRAAVYTIGLLGACIGLALNDRFKSLWSQKTIGFLLAVLFIFSLAAVIFIFVINQKCLGYKQRRAKLEQLLGYSNQELCSKTGELLIAEASSGVVANWRYAFAFGLLIAVVTALAMIAFSHL